MSALSGRRCTPPKRLACQVLKALEDAAGLYDGRSWLEFEPENWGLGQKLEELRRPKALDLSAIALLSRGEVELEYILRLLNALTSSASELLNVCRRRLRPSATKLSKGLASLPDELLSLIFKFATHDEQEGTRYAVWLSQVSHRFRAIVLRDRSLWTTHFLWYDTTKESVQRCINRAVEDSDLHLVINSNASIRDPSFRIGDFLEACRPFISRWQSLTVSGHWNLDSDYDLGFELETTVGELLSGRIADRHWILPRLHELSLDQRYCGDRELIWAIDDIGTFDDSLCVAPNLRVLRCNQYIPPPAFPFKSITLFELSLTLVPSNFHEQIEQLLKFLRSMTNMREFDLDLRDCDGAIRQLEHELGIGEVFVCEALTVFRLKITNLALLEGRRVLRPFIKSLNAPRLERLSIAIALRSDDVHSFRMGFGEHGNGKIHVLVSDSLPDPNVHTRLASLIINISLSKRSGESIRCRRTEKPMLLTVPLEKIPQVSRLDISTFCRVLFSREGEDSFHVENGSLKELQLDGCIDINAEYLQEAVQSLKDVDAWDALENLQIRDCASLDFNSALEIVGGERLRFSD